MSVGGPAATWAPVSATVTSRTSASNYSPLSLFSLDSSSGSPLLSEAELSALELALRESENFH